MILDIRQREDGMDKNKIANFSTQILHKYLAVS